MRYIIIAFLLMCIVPTKGQHLNSDELYDKIVLLSDINGKIQHTGSGFLLTSNDQYFLITAKHVADFLRKESSEIFFRGTNQVAQGFKLKDFTSKDLVAGFNGESDFFILKLETLDTTKLNILKRSSLDAKVLANNRESIDRNADVLVMGYPICDYDHFSPITFKSYFSSALMNIKIESLWKPCLCYLLENPSMEGFSGGPVFIGVKDRSFVLGNKTLIAGIVTGTKFDSTGGKFAVITPSFYLLDLIK